MNFFCWLLGNPKSTAGKSTPLRKLMLEKIEERAMMSLAPPEDYFSIGIDYGVYLPVEGYVDEVIEYWELTPLPNFDTVGLRPPQLIVQTESTESSVVVGGQYSGVVVDSDFYYSPFDPSGFDVSLLIPVDVYESGLVAYEQAELKIGGQKGPQGTIFIPQIDAPYFMDPGEFEFVQKGVAAASLDVLDKQLNWATRQQRETQGEVHEISAELRRLVEINNQQSFPPELAEDLNSIVDAEVERTAALQERVNGAQQRSDRLKQAVEDLRMQYERQSGSKYPLPALQTKVLLQAAKVEYAIGKAKLALAQGRLLMLQCKIEQIRSKFMSLVNGNRASEAAAEQRNLTTRLLNSNQRNELTQQYSIDLKRASDALTRADGLDAQAANRRSDASEAIQARKRAHEKVQDLQHDVKRYRNQGADKKLAKAERQLKSARQAEKNFDRQADRFSKAAKALEKLALLARRDAADALMPYRQLLKLDQAIQVEAKSNTFWENFKQAVETTGQIVELKTAYAKDMLDTAIKSEKLSAKSVQIFTQHSDVLNRVLKGAPLVGWAMFAVTDVQNNFAIGHSTTRAEYVAAFDKMVQDRVVFFGGVVAGEITGGATALFPGLLSGPGLVFVEVAAATAGGAAGAEKMEEYWKTSSERQFYRDLAGQLWDAARSGK
jgi:tetratricopeptide (TPR) repeat protein